MKVLPIEVAELLWSLYINDNLTLRDLCLCRELRAPGRMLGIMGISTDESEDR